MSKFIYKGIFFLLLAFSLFSASWYVLQGDITFSADIGRDFHLFREVDEKHVILIGPRTSSGLFHGPAWIYLNYPAYLIGGGNPLAVGWFWIVLAAVFVAGNFFIAKDLFGKLSAYCLAAFTAVYVGFHTNGLFNPHGAMFLMPVFFYLFIKYLRSHKLIFLILHFIAGGLILQFQMAVGTPLLLLSGAYILFTAVKTRKFKVLSAFVVLPMMVANFILFDLRHEFLYIKKVFGFLNPNTEQGSLYDYSMLISDRLSAAFHPEILRHDAIGYLNVIFFIVLIGLCVFFIVKKKNRDIYLTFLYFYFGFFCLSFINKGILLYFYLFPIFPLVFLIMASFLDAKYKPKYKKLLLAPMAVILAINISTAINNITTSSGVIGNDSHSWKFLKTASDKIFEGNEDDIGFFVYSPDAYAYEGRYAMLYAQKTHSRKSSYFTKKPVTYLFIAPTPDKRFVTGDEWWTKNRVKIANTPTKVITFPNGYKIERYELTDEQTKIPFDPEIDLGIHFR